ncbi:MAG: hypothetical protein K2X87_33335 [Gemmataceae bacterium]|nr:hypothetical protein [Gemmataceae bacterium]
MSTSPDRRSFLAASAAGTGLPFLHTLPAVSADDARLGPDVVRLDPEIEPLVRLLEDTPRAKVLEEVGHRVKAGLPYRDLLAALFLAGVRNVQPRPTVGFKFHAVLVIHSAHLSALSGPDRERWLPLFWAIDNFKGSQAQTQKESGWRMKPAVELKLPPAHQAFEAFTRAMDDWDEDAADAAATALARTASKHQLFDTFARYGCRDFRDIGHKAIYVANAFRTLDAIGWHHSEPIVRSLAYALLHHEGDNPAKRDADPDRPGRRNAERVRAFKAGWQGGQASPEATAEVLAASRSASDDELSGRVVELLGKGVSPRSVWDGLFAAGGELLMRQPGIVALHSLTSLNALHYAYQTTVGDDHARKLLLLQAAAFVPLFRDALPARGKVGDDRIDALTAANEKPEAGAVFDALSRDKGAAARLALGYLKGNPAGAKDLIDAGRRLVFLKGTDSHDYKFSAAVMEDYSFLAPPWRDRFLAASLYWLKGSAGLDSPLVARTRAALA